MYQNYTLKAHDLFLLFEIFHHPYLLVIHRILITSIFHVIVVCISIIQNLFLQ